MQIVFYLTGKLVNSLSVHTTYVLCWVKVCETTFRCLNQQHTMKINFLTFGPSRMMYEYIYLLKITSAWWSDIKMLTLRDAHAQFGY